MILKRKPTGDVVETLTFLRVFSQKSLGTLCFPKGTFLRKGRSHRSFLESNRAMGPPPRKKKMYTHMFYKQFPGVPNQIKNT